MNGCQGVACPTTILGHLGWNEHTPAIQCRDARTLPDPFRGDRFNWRDVFPCSIFDGHMEYINSSGSVCESNQVGACRKWKHVTRNYFPMNNIASLALHNALNPVTQVGQIDCSLRVI